ncbi:MAG: hypothetical protein V4615_04920 [Bacteroidota bacterium]
MIDSGIIIALCTAAGVALGGSATAIVNNRANRRNNEANAIKTESDTDLAIAKFNSEALVNERARTLFLEQKLTEKDLIIEMKDKIISESKTEIGLLSKRVSQLENVLNRILVLHPELNEKI